MAKEKSTRRVRAFRERQRANRPPKKPPKTKAERNREYHARKKALKAISIDQHDLQTASDGSSTHNPAVLYGGHNYYKKRGSSDGTYDYAASLVEIQHDEDTDFEQYESVDMVTDALIKQKSVTEIIGTTSGIQKSSLPRIKKEIYDTEPENIVIKLEPIDIDYNDDDDDDDDCLQSVNGDDSDSDGYSAEVNNLIETIEGASGIRPQTVESEWSPVVKIRKEIDDAEPEDIVIKLEPIDIDELNDDDDNSLQDGNSNDNDSDSDNNVSDFECRSVDMNGVVRKHCRTCTCRCRKINVSTQS